MRDGWCFLFRRFEIKLGTPNRQWMMGETNNLSVRSHWVDRSTEDIRIPCIHEWQITHLLSLPHLLQDGDWRPQEVARSIKRWFRYHRFKSDRSGYPTYQERVLSAVPLSSETMSTTCWLKLCICIVDLRTLWRLRKIVWIQFHPSPINRSTHFRYGIRRFRIQLKSEQKTFELGRGSKHSDSTVVLETEGFIDRLDRPLSLAPSLAMIAARRPRFWLTDTCTIRRIVVEWHRLHSRLG